MGRSKKLARQRAGRGRNPEINNVFPPKSGPERYSDTKRPEPATDTTGVSPDTKARVISTEG